MVRISAIDVKALLVRHAFIVLRVAQMNSLLGRINPQVEGYSAITLRRQKQPVRDIEPVQLHYTPN